MKMELALMGGLKTIQSTAAFARVTSRAYMKVSGPDATRWLNGMVTNSIQALDPGQGSYNFLLNAQGRIQGDCTVYRFPKDGPGEYLLQTDAAQLTTIHELLDRFIIMDDVELSIPEKAPFDLLLLGAALPQLAGIAKADVLRDALESFKSGTMWASTETPHQVFSPSSGGIPQLFVSGNQEALIAIEETLKSRSIEPVSAEVLEQLRILEARPRFGTDIRNSETARDLPQETAQAHALHFAKGCYVGQEIVERIRSRGQVHRLLTPFSIFGSAPQTLPQPLEVQGKSAGELTSVTEVLTEQGARLLGLGYARREVLEAPATFLFPGGSAVVRAAGEIT